MGLGDVEKWYERMQAAVRDREPLLTVLASPWFDSVRSRSQFREIVQQVGLPANVLGVRNVTV